MVKEDFGNMFVRLNSPETFLQGFRGCMYRSELVVLPRGILSSRITLSASQKTVTVTFYIGRVALNFFFLGEVG
jgi:hypothetical protein